MSASPEKTRNESFQCEEGMQRPVGYFSEDEPRRAALGMLEQRESRDQDYTAQSQGECGANRKLPENAAVCAGEYLVEPAPLVKGISGTKDAGTHPGQGFGGQKLHRRDGNQRNPAPARIPLQRAVGQGQRPGNPGRGCGVVVEVSEREHRPAEGEDYRGKKGRPSTLPPPASEPVGSQRRQREMQNVVELVGVCRRHANHGEKRRGIEEQEVRIHQQWFAVAQVGIPIGQESSMECIVNKL